MPISGGVMCQSGTRIGRTKAIESALKASKKVALPITIRATTNLRDVGTCSIRAIRSAEACSVSKAGEDEETPEASDRDVALTTDKASSALLFFGPLQAAHYSETNQIPGARATNSRIFSAITAGHSIGVKWRTFGNTESVAPGTAFWICSDIATGAA